MKAIEEFRQDKYSFIKWFSLYAIISFLAVCLLFGVYIWRSFDGGNVYASQLQDGEYNKQGVANGSVSIN